MPHHCFENRRSPTELDVDEGTDDDDDDDLHVTRIWQHAPDSILLHVFTFLDVCDLGVAAQTCQTWRRISLDESLWKSLLCKTLQHTVLQLPVGKVTWRNEVKRVRYHTPVVHTETLTEHTDEVLHVSFSHNGKLFSTTSKDATLKVWEVGYPTRQKFSKDFRELLAWDFTQFSSFNESDTMVLVSSVKSTHLMDRRGFMAILSLIHDFAILRVVTMDPSQLFGAWLDDTTFLGGSLEISLDRFATTVQIEAHEVTEIYSPVESPPPTPSVDEGSGKPLFTFSSETASLIKFLTVASGAYNTDEELAMVPRSAEEKSVTPDIVTSPLETVINENYVITEFIDSPPVQSTSDMVPVATNHTEAFIDPGVCSAPDSGDKTFTDISLTGETPESIEVIKDNENVTENPFDELLPSVNNFGSVISESLDEECMECGSKEEKADTVGLLKSHLCGGCLKLGKSSEKVYDRTAGESLRPNSLELEKCMSCHGQKSDEHKCKKNSEKNLILVTGEFAVALHQIGVKNVPAYSRQSVLANGATPMDSDNPDGYMVVNYSNNDIHIVRQQQKLDTPDHLIDLFGHVTGLCITPDQRYLFINCRPWVGDIDRSDPWATPDLSADIEVRIIDLHTLKDVGVRYKGHKGFSPPNMCCFVFLDVSPNYVASGSEDAKGYVWDRHYQTQLMTYEHESGVVNAVGFCPNNEEYLVTVSDDKTIKVWRSRSEVRQHGIKADTIEMAEESR